ncbi:uncharacterized protein LTR77_005532 [Saxophila tyrrhenica]|uniref:Transposase n=1 Tax=Saxophila tyrrhenica TaxID=1690608 RepID=A0AAV9P911_9PEZI|nr:hypothetical protein LTR77_005532 [Saxophila tyrrhenica]
MPGAGRKTPEIQQQIKELLEAGFDPTTIHRRLKVGRSSIYRMKRCLQRHGTTYMPKELNKKNGRPKVLTAEQELEVRDWLRKPDNRNRYLDDLVWLIHDRFNIVCSTTTMSKMKRKWTRVIEYEETGLPLDKITRDSLLETHPDLPILQDPAAMPVEETQPQDEQQMAAPTAAPALAPPQQSQMIQPVLQEMPVQTDPALVGMQMPVGGQRVGHDYQRDPIFD